MTTQLASSPDVLNDERGDQEVDRAHYDRRTHAISKQAAAVESMAAAIVGYTLAVKVQRTQTTSLCNCTPPTLFTPLRQASKSMGQPLEVRPVGGGGGGAPPRRVLSPAIDLFGDDECDLSSGTDVPAEEVAIPLLCFQFHI